MVILAAVSIGSLIPFLFHNVFGKTSKMFIGDGGTLVMGIVMSTFVVHILSSETSLAEIDPAFGLVPFTLATMSIPVFDTLRVMLSRILRGTSPFHPDKTHLHHMFIDMGFSHAGTTMSILTLNSLIIAAQIGAWYLGASVDVQLYIVIAMSLIFTFGLYHLLYALSDANIVKRAIKGVGRTTHLERKGIFLILQKIADKI
jgi:UDP-N-acetylmuramyl pentapeptide phosphotransferase/UDP-N-acetylglucosamine-1-phosphate transferase